MFIQTQALKKILALKKRLRVVQGGTAAGKTIAILLLFIDRAQSSKNNLASVVSETLPHLKRGAVRDFLNIMEEHGYYKDALWNKSELTYTFETGSKIEFFSADQPAKVRGPRRNDLFLNECNNISYETYTQLAIRTDGDIYLDFNPVASFWVHEEIIPKQEHDFVKLTYKDNEALSPTIIQEIESRMSNKYFWQVYGLGEIGEIEGKIYKDWQIIDDIPHEARLERRWIDFGYTNDPTAIGDLYYYNGGLVLDEIAYTKGLSNKQIVDIVINLRPCLHVADSAEPKSIDEIKSFGINVVPSEKGKDSVRQGIQIVQGERVSVTKRSVNIIKEYRNYMWQTDKDGRVINIPTELWNHHMDGIRYAVTSLIPVKRYGDFINSLPRYPEKPPLNPAV